MAEETLADKSPEFEVDGEDDIDSSARRGGRWPRRSIRPQSFPMGGFNSCASSFAHMRFCHHSANEG